MTYDERPWLKYYDAGVFPDIDIPDISVVDKFNSVVSEFPDTPAIHFLGISLTYKQLNELADRFAQALMQNGCEPGDVVGINVPNLPQYLIAHFGALKAGCACSGVSPLLTPREMAYQLNDCKAKGLVTLDAIFQHRLKEVIDQLPDLKIIVTTGILDFLPWIKRGLGRMLKKVPYGQVTPIPGKAVLNFMDVLKEYPAMDTGVNVVPEDHCLIQYTGGTTGLPKGTILTHRNIMANMTQVDHWLKPRPGNEVVLSGFPLFHLAGLILGGVSVFFGGTQVLIPNPRAAKHMVKEMARYAPTYLFNVPSLYMILVDEPDFHRLDFSRLVFCVSGASPFPVESIRQLEAVIGEGKVLEAYGMTETSPTVTMNPAKGQKKIGSVGVPISNTRARLVDLDTGTRQAPVGEEGELIVLGPQVMKGYLNKPGETAIALREHEGEVWLHTGDVARMDEDGYFSIVDRAKDMLSVGGFKVCSWEVEEKLYEQPAIEFCAIIGVPNPKRPGSDMVKLVVQPKEEFKDKDHEKLKADILAFARENCAPYKVPKIVEFIETMPLTLVGKVDKKALR